MAADTQSKDKTFMDKRKDKFNENPGMWSLIMIGGGALLGYVLARTTDK